MLKQFVRAKNGRVVGVMVASVQSGAVCVGVSYARHSHKDLPQKFGGDKFDKHLGESLAVGRMDLGYVPNVPAKYYDQFCQFVNRANKYFQDVDDKFSVDCYVNGIHHRSLS